MGSTIFITGSSSGLGRAAARLFAARGWTVIATMRTPAKEQELAAVANVVLLPLDITDPVVLLMYMFNGGRRPDCLDACDFDDSGELDIGDVIGNLYYQFLGGLPPLFPGPVCCGGGRVVRDPGPG